MLLEVQDIVNGLGKVTRVTKTFAWIGEKRYKHNTLLKKGVTFYRSPQTDVDWSNPKEVKNYYNSFCLWNTNIINGDSYDKKRQIFEVKDNMIFHDGEYYLPWRHEKKEVFEDGFIFGFLIKKKNCWWETQADEKTKTINLFLCEKKLSNDYINNHNNKLKNRSLMSDVEYLKSIDTKYLTGDELDLFKKKHVELFDESIFPFSVGEDRKKVTFSIDKTFSDWRIMISHRNRTGWINIDNSYHGRMPYGYDYGLIVKVDPIFTNECGYYVDIRNNITWDRKMLEQFIPNIIKKWDNAIENNARLWS